MNQIIRHGNGIQEEFSTLLPDPVRPLPSLLEGIEQAVPGNDGHQVVELRAFASVDRFPDLLAGLRTIPGTGEWPVSLLDGSPASGGGIAGLQLHLVQGTPVETVRVGREVVGRTFRTDEARYCVLGGVGPEDPRADPADQTISTLARMEEALDSQGMSLTHLVRTWFFLDRILEWYGEFNGARSGVFRDRGIFEGYVPASTGIGGRNHKNSALMASALAMIPIREGIRVEEVPSPLQCPAGSYGSSFSRAAQLTAVGFHRLLVSGTASIDALGVTAHRGDVEAQIELTFEVVRAILESRGMGFGDVIRANAYFQAAPDAFAYSRVLECRGLPGARTVVSRNTVCRGDLLFEMEVDAVRMVLEDG